VDGLLFGAFFIARITFLIRKLRQPLHCFRPQHRRIPGDRGFSGMLDARQASVDRGDQLVECSHEFRASYRHEFTLRGTSWRRDAFQTSPQLPHRQ
jgi:hypothetical protein